MSSLRRNAELMDMGALDDERSYFRPHCDRVLPWLFACRGDLVLLLSL